MEDLPQLNNTVQENKKEGHQENIITVESRAEALEKIKKTFLERLEQRFGPEGEDPMDYHTPEHSQIVAQDAREFLETIKEIDPELVSEEDLELIELEGLAHDLVQNSIKTKGKMRARIRGFKAEDSSDLLPEVQQAAAKKGMLLGNEEASAEELLTELKKYHYEDGGQTFPTDDPAFLESVRNDIGITYPKFDFKAELPDGSIGLKIYQPYLTPESSLRGLALATADLRGKFGIGKDPGVFRKSGNIEFLELQIPIREDLALGIDNISPERRIEIATGILNWKKIQIGFVKWQKILFLKSLEENNIIKNREDIQDALRRRYSNFDSYVEAAQKHYDELEAEYGRLRNTEEQTKLKEAGEDEPFKNLLREIGY